MALPVEIRHQERFHQVHGYRLEGEGLLPVSAGNFSQRLDISGQNLLSGAGKGQSAPEHLLEGSPIEGHCLPKGTSRLFGPVPWLLCIWRRGFHDVLARGVAGTPCSAITTRF
ncbi:MAG: hypothetical protein JXQ29_08790 [Planctomycetes bacterium]|nr:hypothetical protein [Planctomycetota bacterium]